MRRSLSILLSLSLWSGCAREQDRPPPGAETVGPEFAALQERGQEAMGVDQYTSSHVFESLPDGGRIELQRDVDDPEGTATIRLHLREVATRFEDGDFAVPGFVHAQDVPGTGVMTAKKAVISYTFAELPRGGEVRITSDDAEAIAAIHAFMTFQGEDHGVEEHVH